MELTVTTTTDALTDTITVTTTDYGSGIWIARYTIIHAGRVVEAARVERLARADGSLDHPRLYLRGLDDPSPDAFDDFLVAVRSAQALTAAA